MKNNSGTINVSNHIYLIYLYLKMKAARFFIFIPYLKKNQNAFPHISHEYGFSPVWITVWTFNLLLVRKVFSHVSHLYGFSPVWILVCFFKSPFHVNGFHMYHIWMASHLYEFSRVLLNGTCYRIPCLRYDTNSWWMFLYLKLI